MNFHDVTPGQSSKASTQTILSSKLKVKQIKPVVNVAVRPFPHHAHHCCPSCLAVLEFFFSGLQWPQFSAIGKISLINFTQCFKHQGDRFTRQFLILLCQLDTGYTHMGRWKLKWVNVLRAVRKPIAHFLN